MRKISQIRATSLRREPINQIPSVQSTRTITIGTFTRQLQMLEIDRFRTKPIGGRFSSRRNEIFTQKPDVLTGEQPDFLVPRPSGRPDTTTIVNFTVWPTRPPGRLRPIGYYVENTYEIVVIRVFLSRARKPEFIATPEMGLTFFE